MTSIGALVSMVLCTSGGGELREQHANSPGVVSRTSRQPSRFGSVQQYAVDVQVPREACLETESRSGPAQCAGLRAALLTRQPLPELLHAVRRDGFLLARSRSLGGVRGGFC